MANPLISTQRNDDIWLTITNIEGTRQVAGQEWIMVAITCWNLGGGWIRFYRPVFSSSPPHYYIVIGGTSKSRTNKNVRKQRQILLLRRECVQTKSDFDPQLPPVYMPSWVIDWNTVFRWGHSTNQAIHRMWRTPWIGECPNLKTVVQSMTHDGTPCFKAIIPSQGSLRKCHSKFLCP